MIKNNKVYTYRTIKKKAKKVNGSIVTNKGNTGRKLELKLSVIQTAKLLITNLFKREEVQKDAND